MRTLIPEAARLTFDAPRPALWFYASELPEAVRIDQSNPKWIQLCTAGSYVYRGRPVEVTTTKLDQMVTNFRASPAYKLDARSLLGRPVEEVGALVLGGPYGVVALNFDHPPHGAPRPGHGWFLDLERRGADLWGLCWFDAEAHTGLLGGSWKWTSIEWDEQPDNKGRDRGAYLSGVALTNDPFITGMRPIQMAQNEARSPGGVLLAVPERANIPDDHGTSQEIQPMTTPAAPTPAPVSLFHRHAAARLSALLATAITPEDEPALTKAFDAYGSRYDQAMAAVETLQSVFGTKDPEQIAEKLASFVALKEQMATLLPEVAAAQTSEEAIETDMAAQDVEAVMSAQRLDPAKHPGTKVAYMAQRLGASKAPVIPTAEDVAKSPAKLTAFFSAVRARREQRPGLRKAFFEAHGIEGVVNVPPNMQHLYGRMLFAGNGAIFGIDNAGAPPPGGPIAAGQKPPSPEANGFTWSRVNALPPAAKNDSLPQRIFEEVARSEMNNDVTGARFDHAWARVNKIMSQLGPRP